MLSSFFRGLVGAGKTATVSRNFSGVLTQLAPRDNLITTSLSSSAFTFNHFQPFSTANSEEKIFPVASIIKGFKQDVCMSHISIPAALKGGRYKGIATPKDLIDVIEGAYKLSLNAMSRNAQVSARNGKLVLESIPAEHLREIITSVEQLNEVIRVCVYEGVSGELFEKLGKEHIQSLYAKVDDIKQLEDCPTTNILNYLDATTLKKLINSVDKLQSCLAWSNSVNTFEFKQFHNASTKTLLDMLGADFIMGFLKDGNDLAKLLTTEVVTFGLSTNPRGRWIDREAVNQCIGNRLGSFKNVEHPEAREENTIKPSMGLRFSAKD